MIILKWVLGGVTVGAVGAGIWAAIAYGTHREIGWIAWGVGALVGFGVRLMARDDQGYAPGITAAAIAVLSIIAGKFVAAMLLVSSLGIVKVTVKVSDQNMIASFADEICDDRIAKGKKIVWPPGKNREKAHLQADYPADIWQEATKKWQKLGPDEQERRKAERNKDFEELGAEFTGRLRRGVFMSSFSGFDILWFLLATITAFKLGSGLVTSED